MVYKQPITFLIDRKGKIYFHNIDLFHDHEDLIYENTIPEKDVCRLIYDPNEETTSFCGIPGISASCNVLYDALPFELKSTHLNAIESWIKEYDNIVEYAEEHKDEYEPKDNIENFVRSLNRLRLATAQCEEDGTTRRERCEALWEEWVIRNPILKQLHKDSEIEKMLDLNIIDYSDEDQKEYLESCIHKAESIQAEISLARCTSFFEEKLIQESDKHMKIRRNLDLARFIEVSNKIIQESGEPGGYYFTIGGQLLYEVITAIAERACEINDKPILELLERLKMVERE